MATLNALKSGGLFTLATALHQNWFRFIQRSPSSPCSLIYFKSTNVDVLDLFTTHILSRKNPTLIKFPIDPQLTDKDSSSLQKHMISEAQLNNSFDKSSFIIEDWSQAEIDNFLTVCMNCSDRESFNKIIEQILMSKQLPSEEIILKVLCHLCDDADNSMETITRLIDVCQEKNLAFYAKNTNFAPFLSQYLWKLERFDDALNTLNAIFSTTNKNAKSLILRNYRQIIYDAVKNHDDIVLDKVIMNAIKINDKHKDPTLITYVWSDCFFSDLFRHHQKADEIFIAHDFLRTIVSRDIGWIALTLLQQHNVDAIHRLIEQCLAVNLIREVGICLTALFDYHCK